MTVMMQRNQAVAEKRVFISCIVPVYNEISGIENFLAALTESLTALTAHYEIIVIDDGSQDGTQAKLLELTDRFSLRLLGFSRNFGKEMALTAGLQHCSGEVAILMDADFQHPLELLPEFLARWCEGYDQVYGVRKNRNADSRIRRGLTHLFYWLMAKLSHIKMPENAGDFRLLDRKVIDTLNTIPERTRFMKGLYAWTGFTRTAILFDVPLRQTGRSSWGMLGLTDLALTAITAFSDIPLRVWSFAGFLISLIALIYAIYIVTVTLLYGTDLPGFPSIIVAVMFFGGIQLLSIGILGEYIARIFTEVKQRPKYVIAVKKGF
jgi:polyisoprenyl-phosphate glycosyltransferase